MLASTSALAAALPPRAALHQRPTSAAAAPLGPRRLGSRRHDAAAFRAPRRTVGPAGSLPGDAVQRAVEILKEDHGKPTDREVAAGASAAVAAAATAAHQTVAHTSTALGYLLREAPLRTWLPLLSCVAAAAAGMHFHRPRFVWGALGGAASFFLSVWQVLAPLVRRFQALRARLIHNDLASKHRLDTAAGQLNKALSERNKARQEAAQAKRELQAMQQAIQAAAAGGPATAKSSGDEGGGEESASCVEALQRLLEERQQREQRLAGILTNALNASEDAEDAYGERAVDRSNAVELAAALQARVDALRRQAQAAAEAQDALIHMRAQLRERTDDAAALEAQLQLAQADAGKLPALQERVQGLEWELMQVQRQRRQELQQAGEAAGAAAAAAAKAAGVGSPPATNGAGRPPSEAAASGQPVGDKQAASERQPQLRATAEVEAPAEGSPKTARRQAAEGEEEEAPGTPVAEEQPASARVVQELLGVAVLAGGAAAVGGGHVEATVAELDGLQRKLRRAEALLNRTYAKGVPSLESKLLQLQAHQADLESYQHELEEQLAEDEAVVDAVLHAADGLDLNGAGGGMEHEVAARGQRLAAAGEHTAKPAPAGQPGAGGGKGQGQWEVV